MSFRCLQFFQKTNQKGKKSLFVFWKNWRHQKVLLKFMFFCLWAFCRNVLYIQLTVNYKCYLGLCISLKTLFIVKFCRPLNVAYSQNVFSLWSRSQNNVRNHYPQLFNRKLRVYIRDEFELEFSGLSRAELWRFQAKPSWGTSELKLSWQYWQYVCHKIVNV